MKELHIHLSMNPKLVEHINSGDAYLTLWGALKALKDDEEIIHTTQPHVCNTIYLLEGYKIFAHMLDGEVVEIKLGECCGREIRIAHHLENMLLANVFGLATED